jgi:GT2 family glycosyltransferase
MSDRVALVVLSHNGLPVSQKFMRQLKDHTDPEKLQLIWIDNGSTDGTTEWLAGVDDFHAARFFCPENKGVIGGRNMGFEVFFKGGHPQAGDVEGVLDCPYLLFLDNDQYVKEGWLEQHFSVLNSGYDLIGVEAWQLSSNFLPVKRVTQEGTWFNYVGCGGMLIRRAAAEKIGSFDDIFNPSYYEDPDYCFRAAELKLKVGWNANSRIIHVPHQTLGVASDRSARFVKSLNAFRQKYKGKTSPRFVQTKLPAFEK